MARTWRNGSAYCLPNRQSAEPGEVLVSSTVKDLLTGSGLAFDDRGIHELKGVAGDWHVYGRRRGSPDRSKSSEGIFVSRQAGLPSGPLAS